MNAAEYQRSDGMQLAGHCSTLTGELYDDDNKNGISFENDITDC